MTITSNLGRRILRRGARVVAHRLSLGAYQALFHGSVVGLTYHMVSSASSPAVRHLYRYKTPEMFERDLLYLKKHCRVLSYEHLLSGERIRAGSVIITFDDGYRECLSIVRPLLLKHGLPCVFFVTSDFIDNRTLFYRNKVSLCIEQIMTLSAGRLATAADRVSSVAGCAIADRGGFVSWLNGLQRSDEALIDRVCEVLGVDWMSYLRQARPFMTTEEIRVLADDGFTIGAHSCSHPRIGELSPEAAEHEIVESCRRVREMTAADVVPFAFPFSAEGVASTALESMRSRHAFVGHMFDCRGITRTDSWLIDRIWADPPPSGGVASNVGALLRGAYEDFVLSRC